MKLILTIIMYLAVTSTSSIAGFRTGDGGNSSGGNGFSIKAGNSNFYDNYSDDPVSDPTISDTSNKAAAKTSNVVKKDEVQVQKKPITTTKKVQKVIAEDGSVSYSWASLQQTKTSSEKEIVKLLAVATNSDPNSSQGFNGKKIQLKQSQWASQFIMFPQDENGWSIIKPQPESRMIYVSSSSGNDSKAQSYFSKDIDNPHNPSKKIVPFKTIRAALKYVRNGKPDWILLKNGDEWKLDKTISIPSGKSILAPLVLSSYGLSSKRPLINVGMNAGVQLVKSASFIAIIGIEFYAKERDPKSSEFVGWNNVEGASGIVSISGVGIDTNSILIEGNIFNFLGIGLVFHSLDDTKHKNIIIRRNQILNSYSATGHSQGMFTYKVSMLLEENLFDHNGWYQQRYEKLNSKQKGQATFFNHNAYLADMNNTVVYANIFSRASSIGLKLTSNSDYETKINSVNSKNILIKNNFFLEGEVGISAGGNTDFNNGYRWRNITIADNVMFNIGNSRPTNRDIAFHIEASDWESGVIENNYLLCNVNVSIKNVSGILVSGLSKNIKISRNLIHGIGGANLRYIYKSKDEKKSNVDINNNSIIADKQNCQDANGVYVNYGTMSINQYINNVKKQSKSHWDPSIDVLKLNAELRTMFQ